MKILNSALLAVFTALFVPVSGYSEIITDKNSKLMMDKSCLNNGRDNLKTKFPDISDETAKYISLYGCYCAYKVSQKSLLPAKASDFRNARNCLHYAVLRNSIRAGKNPSDLEIKNLCMANYPYDQTDDSQKEDITSFCNCAALPVAKLYSQIKPLKLNEKQIYEQLIKVINSCRYSI